MAKWPLDRARGAAGITEREPTMTTATTAVVTGEDVLAVFTEQRGFTFDPDTRTLVRVGDRDGWAIARAGSERVIGPVLDHQAFVNAFVGAAAEAAETGGLVGGWYSPDRGVYMCEVTDVHDVDRATAVVLGMRADQETVMSLATGEVAAVPQWGDE